MRILILGGCGYIGTKLVQRLILDKKNHIIVYDIQWFGNYLEKKRNLKFSQVQYNLVELNFLQALY